MSFLVNVAILSCCFNFEIVLSKVIGAAVIPHGDFAFDPSLVNSPSAVAMNKACVLLGEKISQMKPDIVVLSTPHGQSLDANFAIYGNSLLSGYAPIGQDLNDESHDNYDVRLNAISSPSVAEALVSSIGTIATSNISLLSSWGDSEPSPLRWAEVIPMSFLNDTLSATEFVIISHPTRRYTESQTMVDEIQAVGSSIYITLDALNVSAMLIISSDLAHTHSEDGPYGYSVTAEPFDEAIMNWGATQDDFYLLREAKALVDQALSCGWTGIVMLNGFLKEGNRRGVLFCGDVGAYSCPTYYGMMVSSFFLIESNDQ